MRRVNTVILCEDRQHEVFVRRFLKRRGRDTRNVTVQMSPRGSAEQFVREQYPVELAALRRRAAKTLLVVVTDGDRDGVRKRHDGLHNACRVRGMETRRANDPVLLLVPTWNIETWFAYADGATVDETKSNYPRLAKESDCQRHVDALAAMCERGTLRQPAPGSLRDACAEYRRLRPV